MGTQIEVSREPHQEKQNERSNQLEEPTHETENHSVIRKDKTNMKPFQDTTIQKHIQGSMRRKSTKTAQSVRISSPQMSGGIVCFVLGLRNTCSQFSWLFGHPGCLHYSSIIPQHRIHSHFLVISVRDVSWSGMPTLCKPVTLVWDGSADAQECPVLL